MTAASELYDYYTTEYCVPVHSGFSGEGILNTPHTGITYFSSFLAFEEWNSLQYFQYATYRHFE
jgi:hypothetical protein